MRVLIQMLITVVTLSVGLGLIWGSLADSITITKDAPSGTDIPADSFYQVPLTGDITDWSTEEKAVAQAALNARSGFKGVTLGTAARTSGTDPYHILRSDMATRLLQLIPLFFVLAGLASGFAMASSAVGGMSRGGVGFASILVVIVGVVLLPVIRSFVGDAQALYALTPAYTGMDSLIPLIPIVYAVAVISGLVWGAKRQFMG